MKATHAAISSPQTTAFMATSLGMEISRDMVILIQSSLINNNVNRDLFLILLVDNVDIFN